MASRFASGEPEGDRITGPAPVSRARGDKTQKPQARARNG